MDNIQYPVTGSSGWGTKINNNFKEISDTIGSINKDSDGDIGTQLNDMAKQNIYSVLKDIKGTKWKFIGDSILTGGGGTGCDVSTGELIPGTTRHANSTGHCWCNSLIEYLSSKYNCTGKNWGTGGSTSKDLIDNISNLVEDDDDIVFVFTGANDLTLSNSLNTLKTNLKAINSYCVSHNKKVIFSGTIQKQTGQTGDIKLEDVENTIRELTTEIHAYYIPMFKLWDDYIILSGIEKSLIYYDNAHPNDLGNDIMYYLIANYMGLSTDIDLQNIVSTSTDWDNLTLGDGITTDPYDKALYKKERGHLLVTGNVKGQNTVNSVLAQLPLGFRTSADKVKVCPTTSGIIGVRIKTTGEIIIENLYNFNLKTTEYIKFNIDVVM